MTALHVAPPRVVPAVPEKIEDAGSVPPVATGARRTAVLTAHGMGQQVPFETLHAVATAIGEEHEKRGGTVSRQVARFVSVNDHWFPRVEMTLEDGAGAAPREVHLFEAYWAPITEGKVHWRDVIWFLFHGARRGLLVPRGGFTRWMFDRFIPCTLSSWGRWHLALAIVVLAIVAVLGPLLLAYPALAIAGAFARGPVWIWEAEVVRNSGALVLWLTCLVMAVLGLALVTSTLPYWMGGREWRAGSRVSLAALTLVGALILYAAAAIALPAAVPGVPAAAWRWLGTVAAHWMFALGGGAAALVLRYFMVQYVGDVAAYVSAHTVGRFAEIRSAIQKVGREVAHAVYGAKTDDGESLLYTDVVMLGHSLGSVVAYDMLNESIRRDLALASRGQRSLEVVARTRTFITFGSPLDKTAFFFRTQKDDLLVREVLAAAVQPLIVSVVYRPQRWINIWSPWDWISGRLEYYSDPEQPKSIVENRVDPDAPVSPAGAHTGYWDRAAFRTSLGDAVR